MRACSVIVTSYGAPGDASGALAVVGGWGLSTYVFEVTFAPAWGWLAVALVAVPALTVVVGLSGSRGVASVPPLEVLRRFG